MLHASDGNTFSPHHWSALPSCVWGELRGLSRTAFPAKRCAVILRVMKSFMTIMRKVTKILINSMSLTRRRINMLKVGDEKYPHQAQASFVRKIAGVMGSHSPITGVTVTRVMAIVLVLITGMLVQSMSVDLLTQLFARALFAQARMCARRSNSTFLA